MNHLFNFSTAYLILALMFLVMPVATWLTLSSLRSATVNMWCFGNVLFGWGILFVGLRANLPEWMTYPLANFLIWFSGFMMMRAISMELKRPFAWHWILLLCLGSLMVFESLRASAIMQTFRFAWGLGMPMFAFACVALWTYRLHRAEKSQSALWITGVFTLAVVGLAFRIGRLLLQDMGTADALAPSMDGTITVITGMLAAIFGNMGYIGLYLERAHRRDKEIAIEQERRLTSDRLGAEIANLDRQRSMSEMSAALAHELSQPLTAAKVDSHVLEVELQQIRSLPEKVKEALVDLQISVERAVQIVSRIHDFMKSREPKMERVCWQDIYKDVINLLPKSERPLGSIIEWHTQGLATSSWIRGDSIQLSQVLLNLLRNALQANSTTRHLRIKVVETLIDKHVCLSIIDNGKGMDDATIQSAITAFFSTKNDGLGVGLAISKSILEQHGGGLSIQSVLGQGTHVKLTLPIYKTN